MPIAEARAIVAGGGNFPADGGPLETMVDLPGVGLKWVEIEPANIAALQARANTWTNQESANIEAAGAEDVHGATDGDGAGVTQVPAALAEAPPAPDALLSGNEGLLAQLKTFNNPLTTNTYTVGGVSHTVSYTRSAKGGIDFHTPTSAVRNDTGANVAGGWAAAHVDAANRTDILVTGASGTKYIDLLSGGKYIYPWASNRKARNIHFRAANRKHGVISDGQLNAGWTWHHEELPVGSMVPVRHEVHKRHAHNGGVHLWP